MILYHCPIEYDFELADEMTSLIRKDTVPCCDFHMDFDIEDTIQYNESIVEAENIVRRSPNKITYSRLL